MENESLSNSNDKSSLKLDSIPVLQKEQPKNSNKKYFFRNKAQSNGLFVGKNQEAKQAVQCFGSYWPMGQPLRSLSTTGGLL